MPTDWEARNRERFNIEPGKGFGPYQLSPCLAKLKNGRFKVYWSWATASAVGLGSNTKCTVARGQPRNGWATVQEARAFEDTLPPVPNYYLGTGYTVPYRQFDFCLRCGDWYGQGGMYAHKCAAKAVVPA